MANVFSNFTNKHSLSKTLRFELKPEGKTLENMRNHLQWNEDLQTFFKDQEIENAYKTLKPVFDLLHEQFITESLESEISQKIDFTAYLEKYRNKRNVTENDLKNTERTLRISFEQVYQETSEKLKLRAGKNEKDKDILIEKGYKILTEKGILEYIKRNCTLFSEINSQEEIEKALKAFEGFFTYLGGFNQNRENYYTTKEEKTTAVATRIVHENLPKFCDNVLFFESRNEDYMNAYTFLQALNRNLANKNGETLLPIQEEIFKLNHFNLCLSQKQIDVYNDQISNANYIINLYNQAHHDNKEFKKLEQFKTLYKQIGCGKRKSLFFSLTCDTKAEAEKARNEKKDAFSVEEILHLAKQAGEKYFQRENNDGSINTIPEFLTYILEKANDAYKGVYWSKTALNTISNKYFANYHDLKDRLKAARVFQNATKGSEEDIKIPDAIELADFFAVLDEVDNWRDENTFFRKSLTEEVKDVKENTKNQKRRQIIEEAAKPSQALLRLIFSDIHENIEQFFDSSSTMLDVKEYKSKESKEIIKTWMDYALTINQMVKYFLVKEDKIKKRTPLDSEIANALKTILIEGEMEQNGKAVIVDWFKWYDALRNYLTQKPQDDVKENKLKLNFENSKLAGGWDINKESDNYCVILQDMSGKQYLGIIAKQERTKGYNKIFEKTPYNPLYKIDTGEVWQKMDYKQIASPTGIGGFVRKCFNTAQQYGWKCPEDCLNSEGKIIIKNDEAKVHLKAIVDCYKDFFNKYEKDGFKYKDFSFNFNESGEYGELSNFFEDVEKQGYKLNFTKINKRILDQWVDESKIYLFEIKNQDSNAGKKEGHKNNLHTMYWKALFENIDNRPKLNGGTELFYQKALPKEKQVKIKDKNGKEIIRNFRFTRERFLFHVPITLNFCLKETRINDVVNKEFSNDNDIYFLGLDRGEKHLVYYSLVNQRGEMIEQGTLNTINGHNYQAKLDELEKNRQEARKNWQTIGTIKELKEGYISQVVRAITDRAVKHKTYIVLEDLNTGFKRGRQKIEKSIYQKFELALAKKLNFLVDKSAKNGEIGSVTQALQLTPPVNNYGDIENRKQVGIMLYTRANYTSQTDPATGWRKTIYLKKGSEESIKEQILNTFTDIGFDSKDYYFTYNAKNTDKQWTLYSGKNGVPLDRFRGKRGDKNEWVNEPVNIVSILSIIFKDFDQNRSFYSQIADEKAELTKGDNKNTAWESLRFAIDVIQQIRNTGETEQDNDFLHSPVRDKHGNHFDSRIASQEQPNSGDANGAFNIARKGILMKEHIQTWIKNGKPKYDQNTSDLNLFISETEWDLYLADKEEWGQQLDIFSSREAIKK